MPSLPQAKPARVATPTIAPKGDPAVVAEASAALELIRPAVQDDGGDVELVSVDADGTAHIRFLGACIGCPSSEMTLRDGIERHLVDRVDAVRRVEAVEG